MERFEMARQGLVVNNTAGPFCFYADAQATIAALQARVKELQGVADEKCRCFLERAEQAESQLTQRTAERDTARRRVDELEAREVDVVMLREDLEQRTAELEAAKADKAKWEDIAGLRFAGDHKFVKEMELLKVENANLQAELERVRGELVEATHNVNVYQSLYSTGCMDRALLENELRDIRALIMAYADAKIDFDDKRLQEDHHAWRERYNKLVEAENALLQHRQGMEG